MSAPPDVRLDRLASPGTGVVLLELAGELDLAVGERFHALMAEIAAEAPRLVVADMTEVGFLDSTMLRELLRAHRAFDEAGGRLVITAAQLPVRRLLELTGTDEVFTLASTRDEALGTA
ncbi:MAG: STAS domain-containing protein [Solirubrobacteraceae bacterium]